MGTMIYVCLAALFLTIDSSHGGNYQSGFGCILDCVHNLHVNIDEFDAVVFSYSSFVLNITLKKSMFRAKLVNHYRLSLYLAF